MSLNMISSLHSCSFWMTDFEDEIILLTVIVLLCSITLVSLKLKHDWKYHRYAKNK